MTEKDSNAYRIGHKDGYDEIISKMHDILGKCYNTGYKDAMDFVCEWLDNYLMEIAYQYDWKANLLLSRVTKRLKKVMEEQICKETSK